MIEYLGNDVLRINHALKVYGFAGIICRSESLSREQVDTVEIAAVLHDIGIPISEKKYNSCIGKYQELEGPPIARAILSKLEVDRSILDRVCFIIGNHHTYTKIDKIDFQIVVEADFLVNIFEDDLYSSAGAIGEKYFKTKTGRKLLSQMYTNH
jgi:HD superfamily phosphodiesterase